MEDSQGSVVSRTQLCEAAVRTQDWMQLVKFGANLAASQAVRHVHRNWAVLALDQIHACAGHELPRNGKEPQPAHDGAKTAFETGVRSTVADTLVDRLGMVVQSCRHHKVPVVDLPAVARVFDRASLQVAADTQAEHHAVPVHMDNRRQARQVLWHLEFAQLCIEQGIDCDTQLQQAE